MRVFLVWKRKWIEPAPPCNVDMSFANVSPDSPQVSSLPSTDTEEDETEDEKHTVRFKVIGATRDKHYQHTLELGNEICHSDRTVTVSISRA